MLPEGFVPAGDGGGDLADFVEFGRERGEFGVDGGFERCPFEEELFVLGPEGGE